MGEKNLKKPDWFKVNLHHNRSFYKTRRILNDHLLPTVCEHARCPNRGECFSRNVATYMILGDHCTRDCAFCAVNHGKPDIPDPNTAAHLLETAKNLGLKHVVITSVTRDDLKDGGASVFAEVIHALHKDLPSCSVEVLIPDFLGNKKALHTVFHAQPEVLNHNVETIARLYPSIRKQADYQRSLEVLQTAKETGLLTKSGFMVGLGETQEEIIQLLKDLRSVQCDILTVGQYLQPKKTKAEVQRYYELEEFQWIKEQALQAGFLYVASGPLVRSSYLADEIMYSLNNPSLNNKSINSQTVQKR